MQLDLKNIYLLNWKTNYRISKVLDLPFRGPCPKRHIYIMDNFQKKYSYKISTGESGSGNRVEIRRFGDCLWHDF
jgi:hypothetical protein